MNNPTLDDEITKRLKRRIKMNRIRLAAIVIFNIIGFIVLYVYYVLVFGIDYANQNTFQELASYFAIEGIALIGYFLYVAFYEIPAEIDNENKKQIGELKKMAEKDIIQADAKPVIGNQPPELLEGHLAGVLIDTGLQYRPYMVFVNFYNNPIKRTEDSIAKKVHADVMYYDAYMNPIFEVRGQWNMEGQWENPLRDHNALRINRDLQSLHGFSEIDFRPDGESQTLYLVIRHYGERNTYVISPESFDYEYLKHPRRVLKEKKCYIRVTLRPAYSESIERWFVLLNDEYLKIAEIEKPQILLYPLPRENGKYVSLKVINNNQDEAILCRAIMTKLEWFEQDPKNRNGGKWIPINTEENGALSWHHGGTDSEGFKKVHFSTEFINIAKVPEDMNHLIRGNIMFTFLVEKPHKIGRYKIWVDVICKTGERFKKETWIGCIDMVDPFKGNELTIMECEDVEEWKQEPNR